MSKKQIAEWLTLNFENIKDISLFLVVVIMGIITRIIRQIKNGAKPSYKWFLAEGIMSLFVAVTVYAVFDQYFEFNKLFTYVLCAWGGSFSNVFSDKLEELLTSVFDNLKVFFKYKIKSK